MTGIISFIGYTSEEIVGDKDEEGRDGDGDDDYSEKENEGGEWGRGSRATHSWESKYVPYYKT